MLRGALCVNESSCWSKSGTSKVVIIVCSVLKQSRAKSFSNFMVGSSGVHAWHACTTIEALLSTHACVTACMRQAHSKAMSSLAFLQTSAQEATILHAYYLCNEPANQPAVCTFQPNINVSTPSTLACKSSASTCTCLHTTTTTHNLHMAPGFSKFNPSAAACFPAIHRLPIIDMLHGR